MKLRLLALDATSRASKRSFISLTQAKSSKIVAIFLNEEKICFKMILLHFVFRISQLSEIKLQPHFKG